MSFTRRRISQIHPLCEKKKSSSHDVEFDEPPEKNMELKSDL